MRVPIIFAALAALLATSATAATPDQQAWQTFLTMAAPAGPSTVTFETWASDDDIYGGKPHWPSSGVKSLHLSLAARAEDIAAHQAPAVNCLPKDGPAGNFPPGACIGEEVQHNRPVFDTIVGNGLTTKAGLIAFYASNKQLSFPSDAIVVKADWALVSDVMRWLPQYKSPADVRRAYYTNIATMNGVKGEYALLGMSVQSKTMKDWLWSTFEHRSNPGRCDIIGCHDSFGAAIANVAPGAINSDYGLCAKTPALAALFAGDHLNPVWNNYCLKGTQTTFTGPDGKPTILANSVIERMNKGVAVTQTSCITCHAYASFDSAAHPNYDALALRPTGKVQPKLLDGFKLHDYVWGILAIEH